MSSTTRTASLPSETPTASWHTGANESVLALTLSQQHAWCRMHCKPVPGFRVRPHRWDCPFNPRFREVGTES